MSSDALDLDDLAALFCVTEKAVRGWVGAGMPVLTKGSQGGARKKTTLSLKAAVEWYFHENYERLELDRARTELAYEQSRKVALENALRTGELGELSSWQRELEKFFGEMRAAFLAFPTKLAPLLDGDVNRRKDILEGEVHRLLVTLASYTGDGIPKGIPAKDRGVSDGSASAAEANRKPVGRRKKAPVRRKQRGAGPVAN